MSHPEWQRHVHYQNKPVKCHNLIHKTYRQQLGLRINEFKLFLSLVPMDDASIIRSLSHNNVGYYIEDNSQKPQKTK